MDSDRTDRQEINNRQYESIYNFLKKNQDKKLGQYKMISYPKFLEFLKYEIFLIITNFSESI